MKACAVFPGTRQGGVLMVCFALMLVALLGFMGLALDLARVHSRSAELQLLADDVALAAAGALSGASEGVNAAMAQAATVAATHRYAMATGVRWNPDALSFASDPEAPAGAWRAAAAAAAAPDGLLYARVDTALLDAAHGEVALTLLRAILPGRQALQLSARAVAGHGQLRVTPLALCPLSSTPAAARSHSGLAPELVEYGFRRGVAYNLLQLNGAGASAEHFLLDPVDPLGAPGDPANLGSSVLAPFFCSGRVPLARIGGADITVARGALPFALYPQLNSRFAQGLGTVCRNSVAPPDTNIRTHSGSWMSVAPAASAAPRVQGGQLVTVAERSAPMAAGDNAASYGPLWTYGPALQSDAARTPYTVADWSKLYPTDSAPQPASTVYTVPPYQRTGSAYFLAPGSSYSAVAERRLLNIPLLQCPVAAGAVAQARVIGVGRFFMLAPASGSAIIAEFAGAVAEQSLGGAVELLR
jgi:hypothetical protein